MRIPFPYKGIDKGRATSEQPELTAPDLKNVRPFGVLDNRMRGGQRPGLDKWGAGNHVGDSGTTSQPVVAICVVSSLA